MSKFEARSQQKDALDKFKEHFYGSRNNRGILSMCCGSGKSFVFFLIMHHCITVENEKMFIYVTSRILLIKNIAFDLILRSYENNIFNLNIIIVASGNTGVGSLNKIGKNYYDKGQKFRDFLKEMKKNNIHHIQTVSELSEKLRILNKREKEVLIITTYESLKKVIASLSVLNNEADFDGQIIPDLITCDESHNLVSADKSTKASDYLFGDEVAIDYKQKKKKLSVEKKLSFSKMLFMTATPVKIIKKYSESGYVDNAITYSMCNRKIYGDVFYEHSFSEGIKNGSILDFVTITLGYRDEDESNGVISEENEKTLEKNKNNMDGLNADSKQQFYFETMGKLLLGIIQKHSLKRIIVYLNNVCKAKMLEKILESQIYTEINDATLETKKYLIYSIHSGMTDIKIEENIELFKSTDEDKINVIISVDMFNEGIDMPNCDSVFFAENRNSESTIAQNIGRCLRIHKGKEKGHVIIPTIIHKVGEDGEDGNFSSTFVNIKHVCDILKGFNNTDSEIKFKRYAKGKNERFVNKHENEYIENMSEKIDIIENKIDRTKITTILNLSNTDKISDEMSECLTSRVFTGPIGNLTLEEFKKEVGKNKLKNLHMLGKFIKKNYPLYKYPHEHYKLDWISYGDILQVGTFCYEDAVKFIQTLDDKVMMNIKEPKDWYKFSEDIIKDELYRKETDEKDEKREKIIEGIIKIPHNPKSYYLKEWNEDVNNGWDNFLNKEISNKTGVHLKTDDERKIINNNVCENIKNILNNDKMYLSDQSWNNYHCKENDLSDLKTYIIKKFKFKNDKIKLIVQYRINKQFIYDNGIIGVALSDRKKPGFPITINESYKVKYDEISLEEDINKDKFNRNKECDIYDLVVQKNINELYLKMRKYVKFKYN